ncbi:MAG: hypothetical protein ACP5N3_06210 [Candidatus Nanoarchaeia archaeon]
MNKKIFANISVYLILLLVMAFSVIASEDSFTLSEESAGNLYLTNSNVNIDSDLYGDLFAFSQNLNTNGLIRDDLNAVAGTVNLKGTIGSDLRLVSSNAVIEGTVFGETMILGSYVKITEDAIIGGPVNINAKTVVIDGTLQDNLNVKARKVIINGVVEGNAVIDTLDLELGPDAKIIGDLSSTKVDDETAAHVSGTVTKVKARDDPDNFTKITFNKIGLLLMFFLIGTVLILAGRKHAEKATKAMYTKFLFSMLIGFLILVLAPFVAVILLMTLVGIPIALLIAAVYLILVILALGFSALFLGRLNTKIVKNKNSPWLELLIGSVALALISIIPVIFWLILVFIGFVAIGAMFLVVIGKDKKK